MPNEAGPVVSYPALTVWQPWASLIAYGCKPFEFRGWRAPDRLIGQRLSIHAGARPVCKDEVRGLLARLYSPGWRETGLRREESIALLDPVLTSPASLPLSSVLCTARVGTPLRNKDLGAAMGLALANDSERNEHSNWGWPLDEIELLKPLVPARGGQGLWRWTP